MGGGGINADGRQGAPTASLGHVIFLKKENISAEMLPSSGFSQRQTCLETKVQGQVCLFEQWGEGKKEY